MIRFDNGEEKECSSLGLKLVCDPRYGRPTTSAPVPTTSAAAPTNSAVAPTNSAAAPTNSAAAPTTSAPAPTTSAPQPTNSAPAASTILAVTSLPAASVVSSIAESTARTAPESTVSTHPAESTAPSNTVVGPSVESVEVSETEEDPDLVDPTEEIVEGTQEEDAGFDVVENITSDVYQQWRQECERKKLELFETSSPVTCKSGGNELVWSITPDSIVEEPPVEFPTIGVREIEWGKFSDLAAFGKASVKGKPTMERPQPYLDLCLTLWPGDWRSQLQQLNSAIEKDYQNKAKHKHSVRQIKPVSPNEFFVFIGIMIMSGAAGKGGRRLFEKQSERLKDGIFLCLQELI